MVVFPLPWCQMNDASDWGGVSQAPQHDAPSGAMGRFSHQERAAAAAGERVHAQAAEQEVAQVSSLGFELRPRSLQSTMGVDSWGG